MKSGDACSRASDHTHLRAGKGGVEVRVLSVCLYFRICRYLSKFQFGLIIRTDTRMGKNSFVGLLYVFFVNICQFMYFRFCCSPSMSTVALSVRTDLRQYGHLHYNFPLCFLFRPVL